MRERPLLFSDPMVRALLSGQKTQTRRVVKPQPDGIHAGIPFINGHGQGGTGTRDRFIRCPYGQPGDRLWVREAWGYRGSAISTAWPGIQKLTIEYRADNQRAEYERPSNDDSGLPKQRPCRPDEDYIEDYYNGYLTRYWKQWRPSIHMPRWACRLVLEIVSVRVERLQDITEGDAMAEGINWRDVPDSHIGTVRRQHFIELWESINGAESWAANPWCWVIEFRRVQP